MDTPNKPTKSNFDDCISREAVMDIISDYYNDPDTTDHEEEIMENMMERTEQLPSVDTSSKTGEWLRITDEEMDDRFKCSRCGNVVHYANRVNLLTFNRWCGRCGSRNDGWDMD